MQPSRAPFVVRRVVRVYSVQSVACVEQVDSGVEFLWKWHHAVDVSVSGDGFGLVVGAGGPTGSAFISAALDVLRERIGFEPSAAKSIVGTSAGAFVAAHFEPPSGPQDGQAAVVESLRSLNNVADFRATLGTRVIRVARVLGGHAFALLAPPERDEALYDVARGPYHPGVVIVTIEHTWGLRQEYRLVDYPNEAESIVRASAAIPYQNAPIRVQGKLRADGAVHSANNVDLVDPKECPVVVVISPMIPASGGSVVSNFHRSQLMEELRPWAQPGRAAVVIAPSESEHGARRDRNAASRAGAAAAARLF